MGSLSEFVVGDTPVIGSSRDLPEVPDMAAQIAPTTGEAFDRSISAVY